MEFTKADIEQIRIDVESEGESAISMLIHKDGTLNRQGNGDLPPVKVAAIGMTDGSVFETLVNALDEAIFEHAGVYDHPEKLGRPIRYSLAFIGPKPKIKVIEFRVGLENTDVGDLLPYVDKFINAAIQLTNEWYQNAVDNKQEAPLSQPDGQQETPQARQPEEGGTKQQQPDPPKRKKKWWRFGR